jgi:hypothetical protein
MGQLGDLNHQVAVRVLQPAPKNQAKSSATMVGLFAFWPA